MEKAAADAAPGTEAAAAGAVGGGRRLGEGMSGGALIVASRASPIMHSWSFLRVSAGSTGIE